MFYSDGSGNNWSKGDPEKDMVAFWWDDVKEDMKRFGLSRDDA